jgi:drug/metabolite transporter (DMT)-like permease
MLIDAKGARVSGAPVAYAMWFFVANGLVMFAIGCLQRGAAAPHHILRRWRLEFVGGACAVLAYAIALWAMTLAPVALVAVLRETSVVFAAALGALFLREPFTARRVAATLVVLAGLVALRL